MDKEKEFSQEERLRHIVSPLLEWYRAERRSLPWRENVTPYRVWISEIMLQQTRVEAVKGYFARFIETLPSVTALAGAEEEVLLKLWEGLGYYNRVKNMQRAAQTAVQNYGGELPSSYEGLLKLPGIGSYTAGAVASIAFGIPVPAVDGNVLRVLSRLLASKEDILNPRTKRNMEDLLGKIVPAERPGDFNQSLMELGARICVPNGIARCLDCPIRELCLAQQRDLVMELPVKTEKKPRRLEDHTVFLLWYEDREGIRRAAVRKRENKGLLAGLWELPRIEGTLLKEEIPACLNQWGIPGFSGEILTVPKAKHIFSHVEWRMTGYSLRLSEREAENTPFHWTDWEGLEKKYALASALKIYTAILKEILKQKQ